MKIRLEDIADLAKVSKSTVSRALADSPLINPQTKERIQQIAKELSYHPDSLARAFATQRSGILSFCVYNRDYPFFGHTFYGPILDSILKESNQSGYHVMLSVTESEEHTFDEHFIRDSVDGVLLSSFTPSMAIQEFKKRNIPLVLINDVAYTDNNAYIIDDNYGGAMAMMEHLIGECGHTRIAVINEQMNHISYRLRYIAYLDAHKKYGLTPYHNATFIDDIKNIKPLRSIENSLKFYKEHFNYKVSPSNATPIVTFKNTQEHVDKCIKKLLQSGAELPSAIFCFTDSVALKVMQSLQKFGIKVPQEIAVAGYDGIEAATLGYPPLTTVQVDRSQIGEMAVKELLRQIKHPETESRTIIVPNKLIVRESTIPQPDKHLSAKPSL